MYKKIMHALYDEELWCEKTEKNIKLFTNFLIISHVILIAIDLVEKIAK